MHGDSWSLQFFIKTGTENVTSRIYHSFKNIRETECCQNAPQENRNYTEFAYVSSYSFHDHNQFKTEQMEKLILFRASASKGKLLTFPHLLQPSLAPHEIVLWGWGVSRFQELKGGKLEVYSWKVLSAAEENLPHYQIQGNFSIIKQGHYFISVTSGWMKSSTASILTSSLSISSSSILYYF